MPTYPLTKRTIFSLCLVKLFLSKSFFSCICFDFSNSYGYFHVYFLNSAVIFLWLFLVFCSFSIIAIGVQNVEFSQHSQCTFGVCPSSGNKTRSTINRKKHDLTRKKNPPTIIWYDNRMKHKPLMDNTTGPQVDISVCIANIGIGCRKLA